MPAIRTIIAYIGETVEIEWRKLYTYEVVAGGKQETVTERRTAPPKAVWEARRQSIDGDVERRSGKDRRHVNRGDLGFSERRSETRRIVDREDELATADLGALQPVGRELLRRMRAGHGEEERRRIVRRVRDRPAAGGAFVEQPACHRFGMAQWCDSKGPGGFMGHTCERRKAERRKTDG